NIFAKSLDTNRTLCLSQYVTAQTLDSASRLRPPHPVSEGQTLKSASRLSQSGGHRADSGTRTASNGASYEFIGTRVCGAACPGVGACVVTTSAGARSVFEFAAEIVIL
ncbi:MAG TPA: hypothetical protein PLJ50_10190, partial [Candidatus Latescibacteria bacterium]|nr:hypothetical protein [Candidatus Latescibacterota bacterium]